MLENQIKFGLRKITSNQFAIIESVPINEKSIELNLEFEFGVVEKNKLVVCSFMLEFSSDKTVFIKLSIACDFEIESEFWNAIIETKSNSIRLPQQLISHLATITVGTARGVLHSKTEQTPFINYFLPTINVNEMLKDEIVIALN